MPSTAQKSSRTRRTNRSRRTKRATMPTSAGSPSSAAQSGAALTGARSCRDAEAVESVRPDGVPAQELLALLGVHLGTGAQPVRDGAGVRPRAVRVRVVGFEQQRVDPDDVTAPQPV